MRVWQSAPIRSFERFLDFMALSLLGMIFTDQAVFADSNLTVSIPSDKLSLDLNPGAYDKAIETITVSTTSAAGYTVQLATSGPSTSLVDTTDDSKTIPTFALPENASSIPSTSLGYGYGFSVDGGANYYPAPDPSVSPSKIFETDTAGKYAHILTFGAKIPTNTAVGSYGNTFTIFVLANLELCPPNNICYYGNHDDGTGTMDNQIISSGSTTATLIASNFSRPNYGFAGWNTKIDGTGTNYGPNETIDLGDLSSEGLQLYAKWVPSAGYFQNWQGCDDLDLNEVTALTDNRDGNTYAVAKYADGQCWMMENLRLDLFSEDLEITGLNTNHPTVSFADSVSGDEHPTSTNNFCTSTTSTCLDKIQFNNNNTNRNFTASNNANNTSSSWYSYGNYYNWYTLTAGNGTSSMTQGGSAVNGDICPASWRLPAGYGGAGDLAILDVSLSGDGVNQKSGSTKGPAASKRWRTYPLNFIYGGEQKGNTAANRSISCSYGTLSNYNGTSTANLWLKTDGAYMNSNSTSKNRGQTVRCLFKGGYQVEGNIHYDANGGSGEMPDELNVNFDTALAANNQFTKPYATFVSWNSKPDGSGVVVTEGGMVAGAADRMGLTDGETLTLYAIWKSTYTLIYDANGVDVVGSMASASISDLQIGKYTLVASNYSRTGYGFAGWSPDSSATTKLASGESVTVYGPNETIAINDAFLANADPTNHQISLYAVWVPADTSRTMQTFNASACNDMNIGEVIALRDVRDDNVYTVGKLSNNNCWMLENLRLDPSTADINNNNTNSPTQDFMDLLPDAASANTLCNTDDSACVDAIRYNSNAINRSYGASYASNARNSSWYSYGIMYNWYTATAGNGTYSLGSGNVSGDICPKGWRLPTGGTNGEFAALNGSVSSSAPSADIHYVKFPANFIYSGDYNNTAPGGRNNFGRFWSATPNGVDKAYRLGILGTGPTPAGSWNKWVAFAVRCVVKE